MRQLTPGQRAIVVDLLSLPRKAFELIREAIRRVREQIAAPAKTKGRRR